MSIHPGPIVADDAPLDEDTDREAMADEYRDLVEAGERWLSRFAVVFAVMLTVMMAAQAIPVFMAEGGAAASFSLDVPVSAR